MKRKEKLGTLIIIVLMAVSMIVLLGACGGSSNDSRLVGTWERWDEEEVFTFNRNGTGTRRIYGLVAVESGPPLPEFTLSNQSVNFLQTLDTDVTIYYIVKIGQADVFVELLLSEFENFSHVNVQFRDPIINPEFTMQFTAGAEGGIPEGSIIVRSGDMYRVILPQSLMTWRMNWQTFQNELVSINVEREITQAIHFVTQTSPTIVYHVMGSEEFELQPGFVTHLAENNFIVRTVDAMLHDIPDEADILLITMPGRDWTELKAERISRFLHDEGRALIALQYWDMDHPNMDAVLADFGVSLGRYQIIEANSAFAFRNSIELLPAFTDHEIVSPLAARNARCLAIWGSGIETVPHPRASLTIEPLMHTSSISFGRWDHEIEQIIQHPNDIGGPFDIAVAVTDTWFVQRTYTIRLVVLGSVLMLDESINTMIGGNNWDFIINSLNWLEDQPPGILVPALSPQGVAPFVIEEEIRWETREDDGGVTRLRVGSVRSDGSINWYRFDWSSYSLDRNGNELNWFQTFTRR